MGVGEESDSDCEGVISGPNNYEYKIDLIETPHGGAGTMPILKRKMNKRFYGRN